MSAEHTPGEWKRRLSLTYYAEIGIDPVGRQRSPTIIARIGVPHGNHEEAEANVKILTAAPRLAAALETALDEADCDCPSLDLAIGGRGHGSDCWMSVARAALRLAGRLP